MSDTVGFIGLGNMGSVLAHNLVQSGFVVLTHDIAGPARSPDGAKFVETIDEITAACEIVVLSLPNGSASEDVTRALAAADGRQVRLVIETSTIGPRTAQTACELLEAVGIAHLDAPVSGGIAGARARTLTVMYSGTDEACATATNTLAGLSDRRVRVGDRSGLAQAMKLANNFLAATTLAATSEAIAFGTRAGLSMEAMLDVLNGASGQSAASSDKFPRQILTGTYSAGFANDLMAKDVDLYLDAVTEQQGARDIADPIAELWRGFARDEKGADFTRVYLYTLAAGTR